MWATIKNFHLPKRDHLCNMQRCKRSVWPIIKMQKDKGQAVMPTEVKVPNIGDFKAVEIIEVPVKAGETISKDQTILVLESDKATMDIPSPAAGAIQSIKVKRRVSLAPFS